MAPDPSHEQVVHTLQIKPVWFEAILNGTKTYELRWNDRNFQAGDAVILVENDGAQDTGRMANYWIGCVFQNAPGIQALRDGWCAFSLLPEPNK